LHLENVVFPGHQTLQFFDDCLALEELTLTSCSWNNVHAVGIFSFNLRKLEIRNGGADALVDTDDVDEVDCSSSCKIIIAGCLLESFSF
jgi:hypothetical protein